LTPLNQVPANDIAGSSGCIEQTVPAFAGYDPCHLAFPQAMNAEAEQIAQQVVARGYAT